MRQELLLLAIAAAAVAQAQTTAKPAATAAKPVAAAHATPAAGMKLPPGVPMARGIVKTSFCLRYQDIKRGTGPLPEPNKLWHVIYTGWRASDGVKFDSSADHRPPLLDKDGKPELGPDGKPVLGAIRPMVFPQGLGDIIPGFNFGVEGMRVGGKRRLFIPWQMAYGMHTIPDRGPEHPGIPAKSDLIFDVELVEVTDMPPMPAGMPGHFAPRTAPGTPAPAHPARHIPGVRERFAGLGI